jgi:hypothetical protein
VSLEQRTLDVGNAIHEFKASSDRLGRRLVALTIVLVIQTAVLIGLTIWLIASEA